MTSATVLALIAVTLVAGSIAKGATGMGLPLLAMPVLSLALGVPHAVAIVALPIVATNTWQAWQYRAQAAEARFMASFLALGGIGIVAGTYALAKVPTELLSLVLGIVVVLYISLRLARPHFRLEKAFGERVAPLVGLAAGLSHGATGISGPIGITYLHAMPLRREAYVLCVSAMFLLFSLVHIPALAAGGILTWPRFLESVFALLPVAVGMPIGTFVGRRMSTQAFDRLILCLLAVTAGPLLWEGTRYLLR